MKIVGVLGLIILVLGLLTTLVGLGGAVANFVFPPKELVCEWADRDYEAAKKAFAEYEASKGSPSEVAKRSRRRMRCRNLKPAPIHAAGRRTATNSTDLYSAA